MIKNSQGGQALLLVVLVMIVSLTVGLSVASRSIVNLRTSSEEADSQKALSAAEAGIERSLQINSNESLTVAFGDNVSYTTEVKAIEGSGAILLNGGNLVAQSEGASVWFVGRNSDGSPNYDDTSWQTSGDGIDIYWGNSNTSCDEATVNPAPAIEVSVILGPKDSPVLNRFAFDPCPDRRDGDEGNHFASSTPSSAIFEGKSFFYKTTITGLASALVMKIVPIYASTVIAVDATGTASLPTQGLVTDSTGTSAKNSDRQVQRKITSFRAYEQMATEYFNYGLFSP